MQVSIRVRPGASRTRVGGLWGEEALVVAVSAPAVDGRANEAVCRALAAAFGVRPRAVTIVRGTTARSKVAEIDAVAADLQVRLAELRALG
ncbi:MAG: DUF167 domain-containing protein [Dermatophilaceae bacterium]